MDLTQLWMDLEYSALGDYIATSNWTFPIIESIHVIALVLVVGTIAVMDLRLLGWASRERPITLMSRETLKLTWGAFAVALVTGLLMFVSKASTYAVNPYFQWKLVLIALAGANMAWFHFSTWKTVTVWDRADTIPMRVKLAGGLSLIFWIGVVFLGRIIGFTLDFYLPY
jgi:hypothetical protein